MGQIYLCIHVHVHVNDHGLIHTCLYILNVYCIGSRNVRLLVLAVVSTCSISGTHAYELGESLHLTCVGGDGKQLEWTLDNLPINNTHRTRKTQVGNSATLVTHHVKQEDAGTYRCHCDGGDSHDHHVVIFEGR